MDRPSVYRLAVLVLLAGMPASRESVGAEVPAASAPAHTDCYGDPLPAGALARLGTVRFRTGDPITGLGFLPSGKALVSMSRVGTIRLWEVPSGKPIRRWESFFALMPSFAIAPDGMIAAPQGFGGLISLRDPETGQTRSYVGNGGLEPSALTYSADGKSLAWVALDGQIFVIDAATRKERIRMSAHRTGANRVALSPDGRFVAAGGEHAIILWDVATGKEMRRFHGLPENGPRSPLDEGLCYLTFTPDGKTLVAATPAERMGHTGRMKAWDVATGRAMGGVDELSPFLHRVVLSHDGKLLAVSRVDGGTRLLLFPSGQPAPGLPLLRSGPDSEVAFSPDGKRLATGGVDGVIRLWEVASGKRVGGADAPEASVRTVAFVDGGRLIAAAAEDDTIRVCEARTGRQVRRIRRPHLGGHLAVDPNGRTIAGGQSPIRLWDICTGDFLHGVGPSPDYPYLVCFSPDGKLLAATSLNGSAIALHSVADGSEPRLLPLTTGSSDRLGTIESMAFSADGKFLAAAGSRLTAQGIGGRFLLFDVKSGQQLALEGHTGAVLALACSPDGRTIATGDRDGTIRLWAADLRKELWRFNRSAGEVQCLAFSPDGRTLATGSQDRRLSLWEVSTGRERRPLPGHVGPITSLSFSPDGRQLASSSTDATCLVWDVAGVSQRRSRPVSERELQQLWTDLASDDGEAAYTAICVLATVPSQTIPLVRRSVHAVAAVRAGDLARLVADLNDAQLATRRKATQQLEQLGDLAEPAVRQALAGKPSLEHRQRLEEVLEKLDMRQNPERRRRTQTPEWLRAIRAAEVLEHIGTPEAREALLQFAKGAPGARLTVEAEACLRRLARPAGHSTP
jgi:WD40 repeat protein